VSEILALEALHRAAQARLGLAAAFLAQIEWEKVAPLKAATTSDEWLQTSLKVITAARKMSRKLAIGYYQLARALETGRTLGAPEGSTNTAATTLGALRKNFRDAAIDVAALPSTRSRSDDPDIQWFEDTLQDMDTRQVRMPEVPMEHLIQALMDAEEDNDTQPVQIDKYEWDAPMTFEEVESAYRELLRKQAVEHIVTAVEQVRANDDLTPAAALAQIEASHGAAGSLGSGSVDAGGIDAGRDIINNAISKDRTVKLIARSTGADPCGFCSRLAGGFSKPGDGDEEVLKFHIHCHCQPLARWVEASALPPLNAYFERKWDEVTRGLSGNEARKAWRRWIYAQRKANPDAPHGVPINP
jgi:hypothetical protein